MAPDLFFLQPRRGSRVGVKSDSQRLRDIGLFDGKLPGQEYLRAILGKGEVGHIKAGAVARNDGVGLSCIEDQNRTPDQGNAKAGRREMHVQPLVLAQKQIAEGRTAVECRVVVVPRAAAGHEGIGYERAGALLRRRP